MFITVANVVTGGTPIENFKKNWATDRYQLILFRGGGSENLFFPKRYKVKILSKHTISCQFFYSAQRIKMYCKSPRSGPEWGWTPSEIPKSVFLTPKKVGRRPGSRKFVTLSIVSGCKKKKKKKKKAESWEHCSSSVTPVQCKKCNTCVKNTS